MELLLLPDFADLETFFDACFLAGAGAAFLTLFLTAFFAAFFIAAFGAVFLTAFDEDFFATV
ncbi:MAG TPA: hypothetical protein PKK48_03745 [Phycisphaerae bacterium]|nr:hypothetical protein [Phycisphaerae bacterium]HPS51932.1 hypothetical protein [Phycisphaerae bacterium]